MWWVEIGQGIRYNKHWKTKRVVWISGRSKALKIRLAVLRSGVLALGIILGASFVMYPAILIKGSEV